MFCRLLEMDYLCTQLLKQRAFSSAGLEHLPYKQRVGGSNPSTPTKGCFPVVFRDCRDFYLSTIFFVHKDQEGVSK